MSEASHPAQPRPAQRFFSFVFWEGGKGKGGGDQAGGSEESASRKNPGKLGHRVMALSMSPTQAPGIPTVPPTLLLSFFVDALFIRLLLLLLPLLLLLFCNYACEGVELIITELSGEVDFGRQKGRLAGG